MKPFRWNADKNVALAADRGITFEALVVAIGSGGLLDVVAHSNPAKYPRQRVLVVQCERYVYLVPFVEEAEYYFLKTVIPSRKATRDFVNRREAHGED